MEDQPDVTALIVSPDGTIETRTITPDIETLQRLVGGWIESISVSEQTWHAYLNEEGKIDGLPVNGTATRLANTLGWAAQDVLVGPVVFLGDTDDGTEADVPAAVLLAASELGHGFDVR